MSNFLSEYTISLLTSVGILVFMVLFVPCIEFLARRLRRSSQRSAAAPEPERTKVNSRRVA